MNKERWLVFLMVLGLIIAGMLGALGQMALQSRVTKLEKAQKAPSILIVCKNGKPVVTITHLYAANDLWLDLTPPNGNPAIFVYYNQAEFGATDILDGGIGNMRGSGEYVTLLAGVYTLRGWSYPYTVSQPQFQSNELVFETSFEVPDCSK